MTIKSFLSVLIFYVRLRIRSWKRRWQAVNIPVRDVVAGMTRREAGDVMQQQLISLCVLEARRPRSLQSERPEGSDPFNELFEA